MDMTDDEVVAVLQAVLLNLNKIKNEANENEEIANILKAAGVYFGIDLKE